MHSSVQIMKYKICQFQVLEYLMTVSQKHQTMQDTFKILASSRYEIFLSYFCLLYDENRFHSDIGLVFQEHNILHYIYRMMPIFCIPFPQNFHYCCFYLCALLGQRGRVEKREGQTKYILVWHFLGGRNEISQC